MLTITILLANMVDIWQNVIQQDVQHLTNNKQGWSNISQHAMTNSPTLLDQPTFANNV